jgi:phospholipid transport system substrate-binding protein
MIAVARCLTVALAIFLGAGMISPASAGPPTEALRSYVDRLFTVLGDARLKSPARAVERQRAVRALAEEALDFTESSRRALGAHWEARTPAERARFVRLFTDLIDHAYISRISLDGETIALDGESVSGQEAVVKGRALTGSGATPVQFFLHRGPEGRWRLYDVSFEGMSLVGSYRAQFNKIIRASSFDALVSRLEAKTRGDGQTRGDASPKSAP